jgi:hypothetical protein
LDRNDPHITRVRAPRAHGARTGRLATGLALALAAGAFAGAGGAALAKGGVAGLPVRERRQEPPNQGAPSPPERYRALLVPGPSGSVFVGGYADSKPSAFLLARMSATGTLVKGFADGGVMTVPAVHWFNQDPPRMLALAGGGLLIVGLDRADQLAVVRVTALGRLDRGFGHDGVAQYTLPHAPRFTIITAAAVQPNGDILVVYQKELPQPLNQPRVPEGQGNGAIEYVRLLPSGELDRSFGSGGHLAATGEKVGLIEGESGTVGACAETLAANGTLLVAYENFALEELDPAGAVVTSFGNEPTQQPSGLATPFETKNGDHFCNGLFALPGGSVEGISGLESGVSGADVTRLTPGGTPEHAFGAAGSTRIDVPTEAAAVASSGETFVAGQSSRELVLTGILPDGQPDPALGGAGGQRLAVHVPRAAGSVPGNEEKPTWEVLPGTGDLTIRVGEQLVRVSG